MKKTYITPITIVFTAEIPEILASSTFDPTKDTQKITPSDDDYDDVFSVKESYFEEW